MVVLNLLGVLVCRDKGHPSDIARARSLTPSARGTERFLTDAEVGLGPAGSSNTNPRPDAADSLEALRARATRDKAALAAREAPKHSGATPVEEATMLGQGGKVLKAYPDGLVVEYNGGTVLRKVKFKDLPESIQRRYWFDPQEAVEYEARQARYSAAAWAEQARKAAQLRAPQEAVAWASAGQEQEKTAIVKQIVSDYHRSHTYRANDSFVCGDMASEVWDILQTRGISAKIMIGNIDRDANSPPDYNHAWVLAEVSSEEWLALETTSGSVVPHDENRRYYSGHAFSNPKQLKAYLSLLNQRNAASAKCNSATDRYNRMVDQYNGADGDTRIGLEQELAQRRAIVNQRKADLNELEGRLRTLLAEKD